MPDDKKSDDIDDIEDDTEDTVSAEEPKVSAKVPTQIEIMAAMAAKIDSIGEMTKELSDKMRHFDQFREDTLAQFDNMANIAHAAKLGESTSPQPGQPQTQMPSVNPDMVKGAVDSINSLATNVFEMIYKWKMGSLADPMDSKRMELGDRVLRRVYNEEIGKVHREERPIREPQQPASNKYQSMYISDHGR